MNFLASELGQEGAEFAFGILVVLIDGRVRASGSRSQVFGAPPDAATARFLGYALIPVEGGLVAVAPRALRAGSPAAPGDCTFEMLVTDVLDLGVRHEAWGEVNGVPVSVTLPQELGETARRIAVTAAANAVTYFDEEKDEYP